MSPTSVTFVVFLLRGLFAHVKLVRLLDSPPTMNVVVPLKSEYDGGVDNGADISAT